MLRLFVFALFVTFATPLATFKHLEDVTIPPALGIRQTFASTPPRQLSGRAVLSILKRQNTCGSGVCDVQDTCCGTSGCCPGGASCCSNGSCCEAGTLCTRNAQGSVGCCPVGQTCSGIAAGDGEVVAAPSSTPVGGSSALPTSSISSQPTPAGAGANDQDTTDTSAAAQDQTDTDPPPTTSLPKTEVGAGTIIGAVIGGILGWLAVCGLLVWLHKRRREKNRVAGLSSGSRGGLGAESEVVGLGVGGPRGPRPYTTLIGRDAVGDKLEIFADPMPTRV